MKAALRSRFFLSARWGRTVRRFSASGEAKLLSRETRYAPNINYSEANKSTLRTQSVVLE